MIRKIIAFFICSIALICPYRLRIIYVEGLGWITQLFYLTYIGILKIIINEISKETSELKSTR